MVEQQPIGRLLFRRFCQTRPSYHRCNLFLDSVTDYELQLSHERSHVAKDIIERFLVRVSPDFVGVIDDDDVLVRCIQNSIYETKDLFHECAK